MGVVNAPELRRVCINDDDSVATLEWSLLTDACGSFSAFHIYGSKNPAPFELLAVVTDPAATGHQFKLPDIGSEWYFYIEVLHTCDGFDSLSTNTLQVDKAKPDEVPLDSVSVDFTTQKIIMGWQKSPSPDVKGYKILSYSGSIGAEIGDTNTTTYLLVNQDITVPISLTIATYDSCDITTPTSPIHSIILLDASIDTCANSINLNWTSYRGWPVEEYGIYVSRNGSPYSRFATTTNLNFTFTDFVLGEEICLFVRAYKQGSSITSSSRYICFTTREPVAPSTLYLSNVTVEGEALKIEWRDELTSDIDSFAVYRKTTGAPQFIFGTKRNGSVERAYIDNNVNVNNTRYRYQVKAFDKCGKILALSNEAGNILLTIQSSSLDWNFYTDWLGQVGSQEIWFEESSTWNLLEVVGPADNQYTDTSSLANARCYLIKAIETNNPYGADKVSVSNTVCRFGQLHFYFPNAINPGSENNTFRVVGQYIDYERSSFTVFNRWGQMIYKSTNIQEGWDGTLNNDLVPMGIYFFVADIWGVNGERKTTNGEIRIIR